ncbi:hypothetical protein [Longimicrobium sp.]|uniref:hypothetical protein n=1 Tax=Longimicrobium sp. TaxID=2029185 RepID=UPI003B3B8BE9
MVSSNDRGAAAADPATVSTARIYLPGGIVTPADGGQPSAAVDAAPEDQDAGSASLGELIGRERRRHAETRAAAEPLADAAGARVCCVLCFNRDAERTVEDAG